MQVMWQLYKNSSFVLKMTIGFLLGILTGVLFGPSIEIIKPVGTILINLLNLVAIPVIFLTVVLAINQMNPKYFGRLGGKLLVYYGLTTAAAVLIGVTIALWINPGSGLTLPDTKVEKPDTPDFSDVLLNIVPSNLFETFSSGQLMGILFLAVIIGLTMGKMRYSEKKDLRESGERLHRLFSSANDLFFLLLQGILLYAPIGIFAISATSFGNQGFQTFQSLIAFTGVFYLGVLLLWALIYTSFLKYSKLSIRNFFSQTKDAYLTAFFTSSSIASLPIAIDSAKKAGISERIVNFSLPIGAVFNSDGGALRMGASIVFAANVTGLNFSIMDYVTIVAIGTLLSIGTAGIPAAGLVTLSAVLTMFNLPLEIVALIAGVDVLIGMAGTASNVLGDIIGAAVIDRDEKKTTNSAV
ncbi:dicarboxylate/amino acid:cation symporter [Bacillus sp. N1-1]|jgi:Na+/H+-dicarboxylate symporter|uniref:dicarboxylate/amino acid:cation symporter n=1 Tax=Bacillus sp. N1-1 TaxID=2682541 RepID=UPI001315B0D5|nr:dicarboxylate/amino acid:cation symporter [Bacillus sp. N1-1]QHA92013.1 cation:dicarboxylase symporter family transporter [Bacillus sp. N1-1]